MKKNHWSQDLYIKALKFAAEAHNNQIVPGTNMPYIVHLTSVCMEVMAVLNDGNNYDVILAIQAALLHDVIEDTDVTFEQLKNEFGMSTANAVLALTKNKSLTKQQQLSDSLRRIKEQPKEIWMVKLADRITNLQCPPANWTKQKIFQYKIESQEIYSTLGSACEVLSERLKQKISEYEKYI